jgi:hypothetical protein
MLLEERLYRVHQHSDGRNEKEHLQQQEHACQQDGEERQLQKQELLSLQAAAEAADSAAADRVALDHRAQQQQQQQYHHHQLQLQQQQQHLCATNNCGASNYSWASLPASMHSSSYSIVLKPLPLLPQACRIFGFYNPKYVLYNPIQIC